MLTTSVPHVSDILCRMILLWARPVRRLISSSCSQCTLGAVHVWSAGTLLASRRTGVRQICFHSSQRPASPAPELPPGRPQPESPICSLQLGSIDSYPLGIGGSGHCWLCSCCLYAPPPCVCRRVWGLGCSARRDVGLVSPGHFLPLGASNPAAGANRGDGGPPKTHHQKLYLHPPPQPIRDLNHLSPPSPTLPIRRQPSVCLREALTDRLSGWVRGGYGSPAWGDGGRVGSHSLASPKPQSLSNSSSAPSLGV